MNAYWDFAAEFEQHAATSPHNSLYDRPAMLELLGDVAGLRVLDAGCGPGLYAEELVARGAVVTALDGSAPMVELARARLGDTVDVRVHDLAEPLSWAGDASFDAAVLALVIHHLDDRLGALRELHRVVRPGGHVVVSTHHPTADWLRLGGGYFDVEVIEERWHDGRWPVRYWRQPLTRTCAELTDAGFVIERLVEPLPLPAMKESAPEYHETLSVSPGFIMFRLLRPPDQ